jgi:pseudaminic acid cytidylyltransferase
VHWPIRAALSAGIFDRIVVSTDDPEIADVARAAEAEVPFLRNPALGDDMTGTTEVVRDAVNRLDPAADTPVCCIYATAIFVRTEDLREGLSKLDDSTWVLSLGVYAAPIDRAYRRDGDRFVPRTPAMMPKRSQDLAPAYFDAGQFYWARAATWRDDTAHVYDGAAGIILPEERAVDIDTEEDWRRAERLAELLGLAS